MKSIDAKTYLSILRQFIHDGKKVCVNISGSSMAPFLINHRDSVCLAAAHRPLIPGDIVFYQRDNGQFVLHRICKIKRNQYYLAGDAQTILEGPIRENQIFARVISVCRKDQWFGPEDIRWLFFAVIWRRILFFRPILLSIYTEYFLVKRRFAR